MATVSGGSGNDSMIGTSSHDTMTGGAGNDTMTAGDGNDLSYGGDGTDRQFGGAGSDTQYGDAGNDTIDAGAGTDYSYGGAGSDVLIGDDGAGDYQYGGNDADTIYGGASSGDYGAGGAGNDLIYLGAGNDTGAGGADNDTVYGEAGNDTLYGENGADVVSGGGGVDVLFGGQGYDTLDGGDDADSLRGGAGADSLAGGSGNDALYGDTINVTPAASTGGQTSTNTVVNTADFPIDLYWVDSGGALVFRGTIAPGGSLAGPSGPGWNYTIYESGTNNQLATFNGADTTYTYNANLGDTLAGGAGADQIFGEYGNDLIYGGGENDIAYGGVGNDTIGSWDDEGGNDTFYGGAGADLMIGGAGSDQVYGDAGNDALSGGIGADTVYGGAGSDTFMVTDDHETDVLSGGEDAGDNDRVAFANHLGTDGVAVTFTGNEAGIYDYRGANDATGSFAEMEGISGTNYADNINASATTGGTQISGEAGDDTLTGGSGADRIDGGAGKDLLAGGRGDDVLTGGDGADRFVFENSDGIDRITDFDMTLVDGRTVDQLDVSQLVTSTGQPVTWRDVTVGEDANGNAVLIFPGGEQVVLEGVTKEEAESKQSMSRMGVPCVVKGTSILTPRGEVAVEHLRAGMMVCTRNHGDVPILWAGGHRIGQVALRRKPGLLPVRIAHGALGNRGDLWLSPQHGVLIGGNLVRAKHLVDAGVPGVARAGVAQVSYHHLLLPHHAILQTQGIGTESLYPGAMTAAALGPRAWADLCRLLPGFARVFDDPESIGAVYGPRVAPLLGRKQALRYIADTHPKGSVPARYAQFAAN